MSVQSVKTFINTVKSSGNTSVRKVSSGIKPGIISDGFYGAYSDKKSKGIITLITDGINKLFLPSDILAPKYINEKSIQKIIEQNPGITKILNDAGLKPVINIRNIKDIKFGHIDTTVNVSESIGKVMGLTDSEMKKLKQSAMFHDYGKILIPREILNKPGRLTPEERKIIDLHSRLSYELLLKSGLDKDVLYSVLNHHTPACMTPDLKTKILSAADVFSALIEKRPYKEPYSPEEAVKIMYEMTKTGKLDTTAVRHLEHLTKSPKMAGLLAA